MGRLFVVNLEGNIYSCKHCKTHLALSEDIVSKSFHCRHGQAYLFSKVVNTSMGNLEERMMMTGMHTVADIFCVRCGSIVGWKYETAHEKSQKYKEGKSVLERYHSAHEIHYSQNGVQRVLIKTDTGLKLVNENRTSGRIIRESRINMYKVSGPDGSNYCINYEPHIGGSDGDDV